jgi:hypothetical protein
LPPFGKQDTLEVGVAVEPHAEKVIDLTLRPVRSGPDGNRAVHRWIHPRKPDLDREVYFVLVTIEIVNDLDSRRRNVDSGDACEMLEPEHVMAVPDDPEELRRVDHVHRLVCLRDTLDDRSLESRLELVAQVV